METPYGNGVTSPAGPQGLVSWGLRTGDASRGVRPAHAAADDLRAAPRVGLGRHGGLPIGRRASESAVRRAESEVALFFLAS